MNPLCFRNGLSVESGKSARASAGISSKSVSSGGFTLIELLIVIAIIAILAAILLPVLAHAKLKATQTYCINNQKELATAYIMYVNDNRETLPTDLNSAGNLIWPNANNAGGYWGITKGIPPIGGATGVAAEGTALTDVENALETNNLFFQYAGNVGTYHCPGDVRFTQPVGTGSSIDWAYDSYAIPENVEPGGSDTDGFSKMAQIHRVSDCMIFVEQADPRGYNAGTFVVGATVPAALPIHYEDIFSMYHGDVGTFSFADGHAEAKRWHDPSIIADGLLSVAPGSTYDQYSACPGGTTALPQKGIDAAYIIQHCVSPSDP